MSADWEWTELDGFAGKVLLVSAGPTSAGQSLVAVYDSEDDALANGAESRALAVMGESLMTAAQLQLAARNGQRVAARRR